MINILLAYILLCNRRYTYDVGKKIALKKKEKLQRKPY